MKQREKALSIALFFVAIATALFFMPWETRWRILSYLPIILFLVHLGILFIAFSKPKYWSLFKGYFVVPVVVYLALFLWGTSTHKDHSGWGGIFLPQMVITFPLVPFQLPDIVDYRIEKKKGIERQAAIISGALTVEEVLKGGNELSPREQSGIYWKLGRGDDLSTETLRGLILNYEWHGHSPETEIIRLALLHHNTDTETLVEFYKKNRGGNHCRSVAKNPKTPLWILEEMIQSKNDYVRLAAAESGRVSEDLIVEALRMSIESRWIHGRRYVADSAHATNDMFKALMNDKEYVVEGIAANPKVAREILRELASRESSRIRSAVISNSSATEEIVAIAISGETDWRIEKALEERQNQSH